MASHRPAFTAFDRRQRGLSSDSGSTSTSSPRSRTSSSYAADDDAAAAMDNPGVLVRALFDFASTDGSSLSFRAGDIINVYHQLETGWWDGVFDGCRGWLPSNYVVPLTDDEIAKLEEELDEESAAGGSDGDDERALAAPAGSQELYGSTPADGVDVHAYWVPRVTPDGELFFHNTHTGESRKDMPNLGDSDDGEHDLTALGATSTTFAEPEQRAGPNRTTSDDSSAPSLASTPADSMPAAPVGDFALLSEVNNQLPPNWRAKLADDGAIHYVHGTTGEVQKHRPSPKDTPESDRREPFFSSSASSPTPPQAMDLSRRADPYDDTSDLEPEPYRTRASTSTQSVTTGTRDDNRRKLKELEESLASTDLDGIPVLALKVRTAVKSLKSTLVRFAEVADLAEEHFAQADAAILAELDVVLAAARALIHASGVLNAGTPLANGLLSHPPPSDTLKLSHAKVQKAVTNLIGSVELFRHASEPTPEGERKVVGAAEDMERTVVAFGLEAERGRASLAIGTSPDRKPKRLEAWLDSAGVALPLGGRSGFSSELDRDIITRPFGLDAEDEMLQYLEREALQQVDQRVERIDGGAPDSPPDALSSALQGVLGHLRSFDIAVAIDLDGEEPHPTSNAPYAKLVASANEILRQYELALDAYTCALGDLACSLGAPAAERPILVGLRQHLQASSKAFMALNTVSLAQSQACRAGVKGRIGARKPQAAVPHDRAMSRMSVNSTRSKTSIGSRRSHLLSLRSGRTTARGLDEEVGDDKPTEEDEEIRDQFSYSDFASSAPASTVSLTGRARQGSLSAMSTVSSSSSMPWESGYGTDSRLSGISSKSNLDTLSALRGRRESVDSLNTDVSKGLSKANKLLGVNSVVLPPNDTPWYLEADVNEDEIVMVEGKADGSEREVKGGSIEALVTRLTLHKSEYSAHSFRESFLMTFKSFTNSEELVRLLEARFYIEPPSGLAEDEMKRWEMEKRMPIRLKVINILKPWITESYVEYEPSDLPLIQAFAQRLPEDVKKREARSLILALETRAAGNGEGLMPRKMTVSHNSPPPPPILPPNRKVLRISDLDVLEVARQLTLVETTTFNRIRGPECLHKSWSGPDPSQGPNIRQGIRLSNEISRWVQVSVLAESQPKTRASVIKFFVQVAERCLNSLKNFSSVAAIVAGINSSSISRLKRTFELLSAKTQATLHMVSRAVDSERNFAHYKSLLEDAIPPAVPFLGVYLTYLTFIEDGNPNFLPGEQKLINFAKWTKAAVVMREIQSFQQMPYNLSRVAPIQVYLEKQFKDNAARTEEQLYQRSIELEPRESEAVRVARLLNESAFI